MGWLRPGDAGRVYAALLFLNASDGLVATLAPPYLKDLGYPLESIGFLVSGYAIASLLSRLPAGRLADGVHATRWFMVACAGYAVSLALYPVALEPGAFWGTRALHGLTFGTATTLNFAAFLAVSQGGNRARATSLYAACQSAGFALGNFGAGILADHFGFGVAFLVAAAFPAGAAVAALGRRLPSALPRPAGQAPSQWRALLRADVRAIPLFAFCLHLAHQALNTLFPLYVLAIGLPLAVAGTARGVQSLTNVFSRVFGEVLTRRLGVAGLACLGLAVTAGAIALVPVVTTPIVLFGVFVVIGIGRAGAVVANVLGTVTLSERGVLNRGMASAFITTGQDAAAILGPILSTTLAARIGLGPALQVIPLAAAGLGIAAVLSGRGARRAEAEKVSRECPGGTAL